MATDVNPYVAEVFKLANSLAVPLVAQLQQTKAAPPQELNASFAERLNNNTLNGSGPSDPVIANASSPRTMLDQITGNVDSEATKPKEEPGTGVLLLVGIGVAAWLVLRKR